MGYNCGFQGASVTDKHASNSICYVIPNALYNNFPGLSVKNYCKYA
jgi:hypothetical protein